MEDMDDDDCIVISDDEDVQLIKHVVNLEPVTIDLTENDTPQKPPEARNNNYHRQQQQQQQHEDSEMPPSQPEHPQPEHAQPEPERSQSYYGYSQPHAEQPGSEHEESEPEDYHDSEPEQSRPSPAHHEQPPQQDFEMPPSEPEQQQQQPEQPHHQEPEKPQPEPQQSQPHHPQPEHSHTQPQPEQSHPQPRPEQSHPQPQPEKSQQQPPPPPPPSEQPQPQPDPQKPPPKPDKPSMSDHELMMAQKTLGNEKYRHNLFDDAIRTYKRANQLAKQLGDNEMSAILHFNLAMTYYKLGSYDQAADECAHAVKINDSYMKAHLKRAEIYQRQCKYEEAVICYEHICDLDGTNRDYAILLKQARDRAKLTKKRDYYKILGLSHSFTKEDLKRAYRQKALSHHPDRHSDADIVTRKIEEKRFKEAAEAHSFIQLKYGYNR